jgi:hypothetical protein
MDEEWEPEAILKAKASQLKGEFFDYIEKNIDKIDANIPVFFGHVVATLDNSLPALSEESYNKFIDAVTVKVLETSKKSNDIPFIEKLFDHAMRNKRGKKGKAIYDIMLGMRMITNGRFTDAIDQLKKYRNVDAIICPAIAYCYYVISTQQMKTDKDASSARPNEMALAAREQMMELSRLNPPVNRLKDHEIVEDPRITKIFWYMLNHAIEWFPNEREFLLIGIEKATKDGNLDVKGDLLTIAIERFYNDMQFLREMYWLKLEKRDAGGVAGVVKQMTQQYPDDIEPVYYGLKLAVITARSETYFRFRKLAVSKNFPPNILLLIDFAFELMSGKQYEALACLDEIKQKSGSHHYYVILLDYVVHDFLSDDEKKVKKAKKTLIDSLDHYCMKLLKIKTI